MGRKKRNTAKTGDVAIYKSRQNEEDELQNASTTLDDSDNMYNVVERFHNANDELQKDVLKFSSKDNYDDDDGGGLEQSDNVFDLGLDESSDDSDDDDDMSSDDNSDNAGGNLSRKFEASDDDNESSDDDDDDDDSSIEGGFDIPENNVMDWGKRKKDYYHGDTADLEIGQDIEDAELEEEAGREVLKARMDGMTEEDFMLGDDDDDDDDDTDNDNNQAKDRNERKSSSKTKESSTSLSSAMTSKMQKNISQLSTKEKIKLIQKTHPELLPLVTHFRDESIRPLLDETMVVTNAIFQEEENAEAVGATKAGLKYLLAKAMLQTSTALNVCQYLLLKAGYAKSCRDKEVDTDDNDNLENDILFDDHDDDNIKNHPVIKRLNQLNHLEEKLDEDIESQVPGLKDQMQNLVKASTLMFGGDGIDGEGELSDDAGSVDGSDKDEEEVPTKIGSRLEDNADYDDEDDDSTASSSSDEDDAQVQRNVMNEARFGVRPQDDIDDEDYISSSSIRKRRRMIPMNSDYGDEDDVEQADLNKAAKSLASTVNKISQRSSKTKKSVAPEAQDDRNEDRYMRGSEIKMEDDLGPDFDDDDDMDVFDNELDDNDDDDFYGQIKKKSMQRKDAKKRKYAVAPKYPNLDEEIEGERSVGHKIMKNRGLVAHKAKINRNPRVKKREQYRKALIRRKGAVREVRTDEGHKYGGEETGIKSGLSRSRKL